MHIARGQSLTLEESQVTRVARRALDAPHATLIDFAVEPFAYDAYLPGRVVAAVTGQADVAGRPAPWGAVLKWTDSPAIEPRAPVERARREALAYRSDLLRASDALLVPEAYEIELSGDGHVALWLEWIGEASTGPWPLETFAVAAHALGRFNAAFAHRRLAAYPWLVQDWAARQSEPLDEAAALAQIARRAADRRVRSALGEDIGERAASMLRDQPRFIDALSRLPQTLCHHDAARSNLIARASPAGGIEIIAIDWESLGVGPLGAEIATLVSGSLRKGDFPADRAAELDAAVFSAYLDGLQSAEGVPVDRRVVRLGYTMSLALRCWFVRDTIENVADAGAAPIFGRARDVDCSDVLDAFVLVSRFLLDSADEARALASVVLAPRGR